MSTAVKPASTAPEARPRQAHWFQPGQSGNPGGKPKGAVGGRAAALAILDSVLGTEENKAILRARLDKEFKKNPYQFFRQVVMPLIPREHLVKEDRQDKAPVRILFNDASAKADADFQRALDDGPDTTTETAAG